MICLCIAYYPILGIGIPHLASFFIQDLWDRPELLFRGYGNHGLGTPAGFDYKIIRLNIRISGPFSSSLYFGNPSSSSIAFTGTSASTLTDTYSASGRSYISATPSPPVLFPSRGSLPAAVVFSVFGLLAEYACLAHNFLAFNKHIIPVIL